MNGAAYDKCLKINSAFEVLDIPPHQRIAILASSVFCAEIDAGELVMQTISAHISKLRAQHPHVDTQRAVVHPGGVPPTAADLASINYQNQLARETNKVALRRYNCRLYKAVLRFIDSIIREWEIYHDI